MDDALRSAEAWRNSASRRRDATLEAHDRRKPACYKPRRRETSRTSVPTCGSAGKRMKKGFYTIMSAQFFSSLADNALFVAAIELLKTSGAPSWHVPALTPMFALFYVILAPCVGAFADAVPKGKVMFISNAIKVVGCLLMLFGAPSAARLRASSASAPRPIRRPSTAS